MSWIALGSALVVPSCNLQIDFKAVMLDSFTAFRRVVATSLGILLAFPHRQPGLTFRMNVSGFLRGVHGGEALQMSLWSVLAPCL
jgi:hypothetical protein